MWLNWLKLTPRTSAASFAFPISAIVRISVGLVIIHQYCSGASILRPREVGLPREMSV